MESDILRSSHQSSTGERVLAAVGPVLWISVSYIGPGKWAAAVEGGARFGFDLALLVLIINFNAILCQYLSALITVATGRNLSQICRQEYDDMTCVLLGIQAEISMIVLDLTMVLGTAYGLNAVFGIDLFNCVFLTGFDAVLFPIFNSILGHPKAKTFSICLTCFILASYASGVFLSQPESSLSVRGIFKKLNGENAYALMGILGANIMPHNFYLHSSIVQQKQGVTSVSKGALCRDLFFATFCIFSGIFFVSYMLLNLAANVFYSNELTLLTLQDALSLLDQGYRNSLGSVPSIFIIFFFNQIVAVTWYLDKEVITREFFGLEIPAWLHRATIRIIAIIPALSCVWNSGAEGIFEFLIFAQVLVALLLPSSVIPLFRVASSRSIMGAYKISNLVEFFALFSFVGMLGLNIIFVKELLFGSSDWVAGLKWNSGSGLPISYLILLIAAFTFLPLMVSLATTPFKSASSGVDTWALKWNKRNAVTVSPLEGKPAEISKARHQLESYVGKQEPGSSSEKSFGQEGNRKVCAAASEIIASESSNNNSSKLQDHNTMSTESKDMVDMTMKIEGDGKIEEDAKGNRWEPEELTEDVFKSGHSLGSEGPQSCRSLSGRSDDVGSGTGSKSSLAGLGHAARHQLTVILDEFWAQLFDFNGHVTQEAKTRKLDAILEIDTKADPDSPSASIQVEHIAEESSECSSAANAGGSDFLRASTSYNGSVQHIIRGNTEASPGTQLGLSVRSNCMNLLDSRVRNASHCALDAGERRYHSLHVPSSSDDRDHQPATIHGCDMTSYLGQVAKGRALAYHKGRLESLTLASRTSFNSKFTDSCTRFSGQKPPSGLHSLKLSGYHNVPVSQYGSLKSKLSFCDPGSPKSIIYRNHQHNVKKFLSLPDVSRLHSRQRRSLLSNSSSQWDNSVGYGQSIGQRMHSNSSWAGTASQIKELYPSKASRVAYSLQFSSSSGFGSLWSKQPCEQFGLANNAPKTQETVSNVDMEAKLLQSFRCCIVKLVRLRGSDSLFRQNDGAGEDLIGCLAVRERFFLEIENLTAERNLGSAVRMDETDYSNFMSVPNCGDECVWQVDVIISFGIWCILRILELSLLESRPEFWRKYTFLLNRLKGVIDLAFSKPCSPATVCFCLQLPSWYHQKKSGSSNLSSGLPPPQKLGPEKFRTPEVLLDTIRDVEIALSSRESSSGTATSDATFPSGIEDLASTLQQYKRRLSSKLGAVAEDVKHELLNVESQSSEGGL